MSAALMTFTEALLMVHDSLSWYKYSLMLFGIIKYMLTGYSGDGNVYCYPGYQLLPLVSPPPIVGVAGNNKLAITLIRINKCIIISKGKTSTVQ